MHIAIIGAGVSGISTAWQLTQQFPECQVTLVDKRPPGTLCSNKGTEAFRTFWPGDSSDGLFTKQLRQSVNALIRFSERHPSMELKKCGYAFFSEQAAGSETMKNIIAEQNELLKQLQGYSFIHDSSMLKQRFPGLANTIKSALVMNNCGWFRTREYLKSMLFEAMTGRFNFRRNDVKTIDISDTRVTLGFNDNTDLFVDKVIICSGQESLPLLRQVNVSLPISYEAHSKAVLPDPKRQLAGFPFSFFSDEFALSFTDEELQSRPALVDFQGKTLSGHFHARENWDDVTGEPSIQALWTYDSIPSHIVRETVPTEYVAILEKGLQRLLPDYNISKESLSRVSVQTGIYTKMPDNMPCIGPLVPNKVYINSALSGYGYMFSQQASLLISRNCVESEPVLDIFNPLNPKRRVYTSNIHTRGQM